MSTRQVEYAVTEKGLTPGERAIKYTSWAEAQEAIYTVQMTSPKHFVTASGDIGDRKTEFVIHAREVGTWKVVDSEPTEAADDADSPSV